MKKLISILLACLAFCIAADAQQTAKGSTFVTAEGGYTFSSFGGEVQGGQYTIGGYWLGALSFFNRVTALQNSAGKYIDDLDYSHLELGADYMWRIFGTRTRAFNLYGGAGAFVGAEFIDPFGKKPNQGSLPFSQTQFIFGIDGRVALEYFFSSQWAVCGEFRIPVTFLSQISRFNTCIRVGVKFNF